jgi:DNA mismatch endonuclease (patch repair protein)
VVDRITAKQRSALMSRIRGRDTKPEKVVRSLVHRMGFRFRIGSNHLMGNPDLVLSRHRKVIFVHGCFWHQHTRCPRAARPKSHVEFWNTKLDGNIQRDRSVTAGLRRAGWSSLIVWECEIKHIIVLRAKLCRFLVSPSLTGRQKEISRRSGG